jgi:hypothetical protein
MPQVMVTPREIEINESQSTAFVCTAIGSPLPKYSIYSKLIH